ncbi:DUF1636 family protein [Paracoccaceae bacterium Fryx2]|nr:DUF1636 family protein [Paracoccaceae bacterium Fryx2]
MATDHARTGHSTFQAAQAAPHKVLVSTRCHHMDAPCGPGLALIAALQRVLAAGGLTEGFEVSGTTCLSSCDHPCTVAWRATGEGAWLFGDVGPDADIEALVAHARRHRRREDGGWCATDPADPTDTSARPPAAMIVTGPRGADQ